MNTVPQSAEPDSWIDDTEITAIPEGGHYEFPGKTVKLRVGPIYLEDFEHIYAVLARNGSEVQIQVNGYTFNHPRKLSKLPPEVIKTVSFSIDSPKIEVRFSDNDCKITVYEQTPESLNLFEQVKTRAERRLLRYPNATYWAPFFPVFGPCFMLIAVFLAWQNQGVSRFLFACGAVALGVLAIAAYILIRSNRYGQIAYRTYKADTPTSWASSDAMKIALVSSTVSAVLGAAIGALIGYYLGSK